MADKLKNNGFSLTEVLMAAGILCIGIMLVATMFPVGIYLTTVASERTMAAIVADQAFAKIQFYGIKDPFHSPNICYDYFSIYNFMGVPVGKIAQDEILYPSVDPALNIRQYSWSVLCKKLNSDLTDNSYLITVFVSRKTSPNLKYAQNALFDPDNTVDWPMLIVADVHRGTINNELAIDWGAEEYVNPPPSTIIIDNASGRIYRVVGRKDNVFQLDRDWDSDTAEPSKIWFLPSPAIVSGGKLQAHGNNPDVEVFQRIIRF